MSTASLAINEATVSLRRRPETNPAVSLLEAALTEANGQGAYLYRIEETAAAASLYAHAGLYVPLKVTWATGSAERSAIVLQAGAWKDERFADAEAFRRHHFEGVISIPILAEGRSRGILHLCRTRSVPVRPVEFSFLQNLSAPLAVMMAQDAQMNGLRREIDRLSSQLAGRKLLDRAKGILQERFQFTEEQAYLSIRRLSRRRRTPMRDIAAALIEDSLREEGEHAS
ncbi:MAG TPA: ANTAR domain-containing protein [Bryobacteraceae bacterium]|nr:ANTAR domain-containing protein [Bryobacteraceae bacterium]